MIKASNRADVYFDTVNILTPMDIGKIVTISAPDHESDDEGSTYESSGVLCHLLRKFDSEGNFNGLVIRLSGSDGSLRDRMTFILGKDEADSGEYKCRIHTSVRL